ncbi:hypothetical protein [Gemmiger sp.]
MKKKRILCGAMAAAMTVLLAACSKGQTDAAPVTSTAAAETETTTAANAAANSTYTGTVTAVLAASLTLSTESDGDITVPLTDATTYTRGGMGGGQAPDGNPPELPSGGSGDSQNGGTPPDMPADGAGQGSAPADGQAPDASGQQPQGGAPDANGSAPEKPDGEAEALTYESISVGDTVTVTVGDDGSAATVELAGGMGGPGGGMGGGSSKPESYDAATEFTADDTRDGAAYASNGTDENSIHVYNSADVALTNADITRSSADSTGGDNSSFYGVGAAALVTDGTLKISDSTISTDAKGGAGVFAYGGGTAYVSDTTITTKQDTSGGIHVAGGGTLYAWDLNVETNGESSAAIRSDRGSGTMVVDGGSYTSNGTGSPAIYSTADISVNNATLTANGSEAVCIEGLNTIRLFNCTLSGNMPANAQNDCDWNVILYQSMSGDSEQGNSTFEMVGGSLTANNGGMFYTTNTESTFLLDGVDITPSAENDFFLKCTGNANARGWGQSGANGADCSFTARNQAMEGAVIWDSISQLDFYMLDGSTLTGAVLDDETNAGSGGDGCANLYISADSTWVVTGDSVLTNLYSAGTIVDTQGRAVTIKDTNGTVLVQGTSDCTVTVSGYSTTVDASGASVSDSFSDYEVAKL